MKRLCQTLALVAVVAGLSGCAAGLRSPVVPYYGMGFTSVSAPVDVTFDGSEMGGRCGRSKSSCLLGMFAWGDCSVNAAARKGNIGRIDHVDCEIFNLLGIYSSYETVIWGEEK